ncbi:GH1 family beta-glucosidase [Pseudarthrobacter sp. RMG13]|uniref:Beta-glucosidase n=1 Tax=Pseudarthrobacter humi TaxID=2952523 RepID=A0ABT1LMG1_9MICC|nr:GH1 family beta-glucosidase [Pseudarthrobacter humi]MCP8998376.1 GH1 family beta-glucosidase [Pseudarthrobacter humi]
MTVENDVSVQDLADRLPRSFTLGVAAAAFQIEGSLSADGRGPSGWDAFAEKPGAIIDGHSPAVACDHYNRSPEDVALMRDLGVDSYRFSISWPRIQPDGRGAFNKQGLDFYDRLIDQLLEAGISPMATLYHWDTPLPLEHRGGWMSRATAERFAEYAGEAGRRFGDRVDQWVTLNEPASVVLNGYALGVHAPGRDLLFDAFPAVHNQLLAHGMAVQALRAAGVRGGIGVTNLHSPVRPATRKITDKYIALVFDLMLNRIYADPVLLGQYPRPPLIAKPWFRSFGRIPDADLRTIHQPLDFYGVNYYYPTKVAAGRGPAESPTGPAEAMVRVPFHQEPFPEYGTTGFGWPVAPEHLGILLRELKDRYKGDLPPLYITESGASFPEPDHVSGPIQDLGRINYIADHLRHALEATAPGGIAHDVDLRGYYVWTLMDNFEWAAGYSQRFGLVHVDFDTLERTPKESFYWYRALSQARTSLADEGQPG